MIETEVEGSPASVRTAATWVGETLRGQVEEAGRLADQARRRASRDWEGDASASYRDVAGKIVEAGDEQEHDLAKVAEKLRTYAVKLGHVQDRMGERRGEASAGGLTVAGTVVQQPPAPVRPADLPAVSTQAESDDWDRRNAAFERANDKVELYNRLATEVDDDRKQLDDWIEANLTAIATASDPTLLSYLVKQFQKLPATAMLFSVDVRKGRLEEMVRHWRSTADRLRAERAESLASRRSGNPARRAAGAGVDTRGNRAAARGLDAAAEGAERVARKLPLVGGALTAVLAANDIANGESPGKVLTSETLAIGAGVAAGAVAVTLGAPVIAVAAVGTVAAVGVGMLAEYAWDHWVPEDVTEAVDEGLRDFGEGVADAASDVKDAAGDAWDAVTPW
ncbi:hypothetical protein [Nocardioides aurantiacus]|uniref:Uncharacterized protein n=1 Tax=Nocardioides aurantiacus TaxID=86796 RepID=A0A3N2CRG4_9ACTN|nr:hypothetical protein [Nocardioides aurantiacus]ROR90111.1 hypothetical protein EDD33_0946 [Nocardioides aurantiacus]